MTERIVIPTDQLPCQEDPLLEVWDTEKPLVVPDVIPVGNKGQGMPCSSDLLRGPEGTEEENTENG